MRRVRKIASTFLLAAFVSLTTTGCIAELFVFGIWSAYYVSLSPQEREEYWRKWREDSTRQLKEQEAKRAQAAAAKAKADPAPAAEPAEPAK